MSYLQIPLSFDASASAFQILGYFDMNWGLGSLTNLIPTLAIFGAAFKAGQVYELLQDDCFQCDLRDIYTHFQDGLATYLDKKMNDSTYLERIKKGLKRPLMKTLFMPLLYGKGINTMAQDIKEAFEGNLPKEMCKSVATHCWEFFVEQYPTIANLMNLLNNIGKLCATLDRRVKYKTPFLEPRDSARQDYHKTSTTTVNVYAKGSGKKRVRKRVTMRMSTDERDQVKTGNATCVNFIHQKDALIAMLVTERTLHAEPSASPLASKKQAKAALRKGAMIGHIGCPLDIVHENFLVPAVNAKDITGIYVELGATTKAHKHLPETES